MLTKRRIFVGLLVLVMLIVLLPLVTNQDVHAVHMRNGVYVTNMQPEEGTKYQQVTFALGYNFWHKAAYVNEEVALHIGGAGIQLSIHPAARRISLAAIYTLPNFSGYCTLDPWSADALFCRNYAKQKDFVLPTN